MEREVDCSMAFASMLLWEASWSVTVGFAICIGCIAVLVSYAAIQAKNTLSSIRGTHFRSMPEMPYPCEDHGNAVFISRRDHLVIAHRTARLNHCLDSSRGSGINAIAEWKERIAGHH